VYTAKAGGFFFVVFGITALMGALLQINPVWLYGPYNPAEVTAGSQPDWYMGWLDGAVRLMPGIESEIGTVTISWNILLPALLVPPLFIGFVALYPFIEAWITGDKREHHLLDRPRNVPTRTGIGAAMITFYGVLWLNSGNDLIATHFHTSINTITWICRFLVILGPVLAFLVTRRIAISLQRADKERLLHGLETGVIVRSPDGGYSERHAPISIYEAYELTARERVVPVEVPPDTDENGVARPRRRRDRLRAALSRFYFADAVQKPTADEIEQARRHETPLELDRAGTDEPIDEPASSRSR
jgi:ubiquinol-cytochrome c reductase cytochrome b subunit